jgi:hypothetical protein
LRLRIEALAKVRAHRPARRLGRIDRLVFEDLGKYVAHQNVLIVRRNKGGTLTADNAITGLVAVSIG